MPINKSLVVEKGNYQLHKIIADNKTYFEIHSKHRFQNTNSFTMESSFDNQDKAYRRFSQLTKNVK